MALLIEALFCYLGGFYKVQVGKKKKVAWICMKRNTCRVSSHLTALVLLNILQLFACKRIPLSELTQTNTHTLTCSHTHFIAAVLSARMSGTSR